MEKQFWIETDVNGAQHRVYSMRVSGIKVLAKLVELARNYCFWLREINAIAFGYLIQEARWKGKLLIAFLLFQRETKVIPVAGAFVLSSVGRELRYLNLRNYC